MAGSTPTTPPPKAIPDYVAWKLGCASDSFCGKLLQLVGHADQPNLVRLREAFPRIVGAWDAWQASPDGEFEIPKRNPFEDVVPAELKVHLRQLATWHWVAETELDSVKYTGVGVSPGMATEDVFDRLLRWRDDQAAAEERQSNGR